MKVLLMMDGSRFSEAAMQSLIQQMRPEKTEVRVLHVIERLPLITECQPVDLETIETAEAALAEHGKKLVERAEQVLREAGFNVHTHIEKNDPRAAIIDNAAEWKADLIIVGSHGRMGLERFHLGSIAEFVARHAPCSVQIVRPPPHR